MTKDVQVLFFGIYPAIPNNLVCIKVLLLDSQRIHLSASAVIFCTAVVRVCFGPTNVDTTRANAFACAWPLVPELGPAFYIFHGMAFHVAVVSSCIRAFNHLVD